jgi:hypothetical protein
MRFFSMGCWMELYHSDDENTPKVVKCYDCS